MMRSAGAMAVVLAAIGSIGSTGCRDRPSEGQAKPSPRVPPDPSAAGAGQPTPSARPSALTAATARADALALVERWTAAQRALDFDTYIAMYEPRTFRGVKRTAKGGVLDVDLAGWRADRKRMFDRKFEAAVEPLGAETWLDPGSKLKRGMSIVRFVQRWKSATYADHGIKVLHVWRAPDDKLLITYEDLLNSEPGWDRVVAAVGEIDLPPPATPADALALWRKLAPTGADYEGKLASIPADSAVREPMSRALLAEGNFDCEEAVEYSECGVDRSEWKPLDPAADLADPCLRRELALWAITEASPADLVALRPAITAMAALDSPEEEIPKALAVRVSEDGEVPEAFELAIDAALVAAHREEMVQVSGLSDAGLVAAATSHGIDQAALALDVEKHPAELAALVLGEEMDDLTRHDLFRTLSDVTEPVVTRALEKLTEDEDCELAMKAAAALADRGDSRFLPRQRPGLSYVDATHAVCMIRHDDEEPRARKHLAGFVGKEGVDVSVTVVGAIPDPSDDGGPDGPDVQHIDDIDEIAEAVESALESRDRDESSANIELTEGDDGLFRVSRIERLSYLGCDC